MGGIGRARRARARGRSLAARAALALAIVFALVGSWPASAGAQAQGVTLYPNPNFGGGGTVVTGARNWIDSLTPTSIRVPAGTKVATYDHPNYGGGACEVLTADDANLADNPVGKRMSSLRVGEDCSWVRLFNGLNYTSDIRLVQGLVPDLRGLGFDDRAESIAVPPGMKVAVYELPNYEGICEVLTADDPDLYDNPIGALRVSSLRVGMDCPATRVTLYDAINYGGATRTVSHLASDLAAFGNRASSIHVPVGGKVAVYSLPSYAGACEVLTATDPDLRDNVIGNDRIASLRVGEGCPVTLHDAISYGGASVTLTIDVPDLRGRGFNDIVSSVTVPAGARLAAFETINYGGKCEEFAAGDPDLRNNFIGNDRISSVRVGGSCPVRLYADPGYGGASKEVKGDVPDLNALGFNDSATAIRGPAGMKVAVYEHPNYGGICEEITADDPDLRGNPIGDDRISSLQVGRGCPPQAVLYDDRNYGGGHRVLFLDYFYADSLEGFDNRASSIHLTGGLTVTAYDWKEPGYNGPCTVFSASDPDLSNTHVGEDRISFVGRGPAPGQACFP